MKFFKYSISTIFAATALFASGVASAIPITTGFALTDATPGTTLCLDSCFGTMTIEVPGGINAMTNGTFGITGLNIEIFDGSPGVSTGLIFGNLVAIPFVPINTVDITNGIVGPSFFTLSTTNGHILSANGTDWLLSGTTFNGGGSGTKIPEPSALALLGIGLIGIGALRRRRQQS